MYSLCDFDIDKATLGMHLIELLFNCEDVYIYTSSSILCGLYDALK
jgi:hypothetical protein